DLQAIQPAFGPRDPALIGVLCAEQKLLELDEAPPRDVDNAPCSQKTRSPLSNSGYPRSDARLTGFLRGAGAGCLPEILQLPPPQEEGHLLQQTAPLPTAVVRSPREWPRHSPSAAHRKPAAGVSAARHKPA